MSYDGQEAAVTRPGNGPLRSGAVVQICGAEDDDYGCTAAEGHTGYHVAYDAMITKGGRPPAAVHTWPQDGAQ